MISQKEMLNIIATEAIEEKQRNFNYTDNKEKFPFVIIDYDLRLVKEKDGSFHWED